jgi:hypothetical protein
MIKIMNMRKTKPKSPYDIRVDRVSVLGNPYKLKTEDQRDEVCDKYEKYFNSQISNNNDFFCELENLVNIYNYYGKLNLFCWCTPKRCHAEVIKKWLENKIKE